MTGEDIYEPVEKLTPYLWRKRKKGNPNAAYYWCPGCKHCHLYPTGHISTGPNWQFDDNIQCPSFRPSMHIFIPEYRHDDGTVNPAQTICHYYLLDGAIQYQGDSRHELAGKTVPMEPIPEDYGF